MTVYRRDDFAFPPARGRRGVEFRPDGTFTELQLGRGDAPEPAAAGRWSAAGTLMRGPQPANAMEPRPDAGMAGTTGTGGGATAIGGGAAGVVVEAAPDRLEIVWE